MQGRCMSPTVARTGPLPEPEPGASGQLLGDQITKPMHICMISMLPGGIG